MAGAGAGPSRLPGGPRDHPGEAPRGGRRTRRARRPLIWVLLAAGAAFFYAIQGAWTKRLTRSVSPMVATWAIFAFAFPLLVAYLAIDGVPEIGARFWWVLPVQGVLNLFSFYLYVTAIERGDLGITYPLLALTPILIVPVEWLLLGDRVGPVGLAGIVLVVAGVYLLNFTRRAGLLEPFRALARDPGARRMLAVTVLWSVSGTLDRVAVLASSPALYGTALTALMGLAFVPLALRPSGGDRRSLRAALPAETGRLAVQGVLFGAMFICQMEALRLSLAAYVISIKRSGTLLTVLLGAAFFAEKRLRRRMVGTVVILAGVYLVSVS